MTIPVNLFTATEDRDVHFHQLHKGCGARVQYQKSCPVHQKVLNRNEIERGFEVSKGHYVVVTDDDLQALPVPSKHTIEISAFVRIEEIDPLLYDKAYYVEPEDRGKKPMALLAKSITEKGMIGIGKIAIRNRETICALRLRDSSVILEILFWPDEIRKPVEAIGSHAEVDPKELKMANSLVDLLAGHFDPDAYKDEFRAGLMEMIDRKAEGRTIDAPEAEPTEVIDLMDALRKSVEAVKGGKRQAG